MFIGGKLVPKKQKKTKHKKQKQNKAYKQKGKQKMGNLTVERFK